MDFIIGQKVKYDGQKWKVSGAAREGHKQVGLWLKRHEQIDKQLETIEIYVRRKELKKVRAS